MSMSLDPREGRETFKLRRQRFPISIQFQLRVLRTLKSRTKFPAVDLS